MDDDSQGGINEFEDLSKECHEDSQTSTCQDDTCKVESNNLPAQSHSLSLPNGALISTSNTSYNWTMTVPDFKNEDDHFEVSLDCENISDPKVDILPVSIKEQVDNLKSVAQQISCKSIEKATTQDSGFNSLHSPTKSSKEIDIETDHESSYKRPSRKRKKSSSPSQKLNAMPNKNFQNNIASKERRASLRNSSQDSISEASKKSEACSSGSESFQPQEIIKKKQRVVSEFRRSSSRDSIKLASENESASKKRKTEATDSDSDKEKIVRRPLSVLSNSNDRQSSLRSSSTESSVERRVRNTNIKVIPKAIQKLIESESDSGPRRRSTRTLRIASSSEETDNDRSKIKSNPSSDSEKPLSKIQRFSKIIKVEQKDKKSKLKDIDSDSDSDYEDQKKIKAAPGNPDTSRNDELKSRLGLHDFNSKTFSNPKRNKYLTTSDKRMKKDSSIVGNLLQNLKATIGNARQQVGSHTEPQQVNKRERLRTSAFKRNDDKEHGDSQNLSDIDTRQPSVSRESSGERRSIKSESKHEVTKKRKQAFIADGEKKIFNQERVEDPIEKLVPYNEILEAIKSCVVVKGRHTKVLNEKQAEQRNENLKALRSLKHFICGNCKLKVSKHKWKQHFVDHGGLAWIEGFEDPIKLNDWNEAVRRTIRSQKIYNLTSMKCPHCRQEKKSALGHLSHLLICCETEEAIEGKKIQCENCKVKFLPCNSTAHKNKCVGLMPLQEVDDGDDEREADKSSNEEGFDENNFNSSGRRKRKAVKK
jgi:hypothetical protein